MKQIFTILFVMGLLLAGCEKDLPTQDHTQPLQIEEVTISRNEITNVLHVQAFIQPATATPLDSVWFVAYQPESNSPYLQARLYDDGTHGDIIPFNQRFSADLPAEFITPYLPPKSTVDFTIEVGVVDSSGASLSTEQVFTLVKNYPVRIQRVNAPDTLDASQSQIGLIQAVVIDSNGVSDIKQVTLQQYAKVVNGDTTDSPGPLVKFDNTGNQNAGDAVAADSIYSVIIRTVSSLDPGWRLMRVVAEDYEQARDTSYTEIYIANQ